MSCEASCAIIRRLAVRAVWLLFVLHAPLLAASPVPSSFGRLPLAFEPNQGQANSSAAFLARGDGYAVYLAPSEVRFALGRGTTTSLRLRLEGANSRAVAKPLDPLPGKSNYFTGNDPARWRTNISTYSRVRFDEIYPGIGIVYYGDQRRLEYDFLVAPGADPGCIRLSFEGADRIRLDGVGDIVLETRAGEVRHVRPVVYQEKDGVRQEIPGSYVLTGGNLVSFRLGEYDRTRALNIDPVFVYSTFIGGRDSVTGGNDYGRAVALDPAGNIYLAGSTQSSRFPISAGAVQTTSGGGMDAFVTKVNASGTAVLYSTYLGGDRDDEAYAVAADSAGNAYVTGYTYSGKFPVTTGAAQTTLGGARDAFVAEVNPTGTALVYCTLLGGEGDDYGYGIAVDPAGNAYVAGSTASAKFPITTGAYQSQLKSYADAFVTKIDPAGATFVYSTYLGGNSGDSAAAVAVDAYGSAYVAGNTYSSDFPVTPDAYRKPPNSGTFAAKLKADGSGLLYSTILEASTLAAIAVDAKGQAYLAGSITYSGLQASRDAARRFFSGGPSDAVAIKLNDEGSAVLYASYFGGSGSDYATGIAIDSQENIILAGYTDSRDFPVTADALQPAFGGGAFDGFVAVLPKGNGSAPPPPRARSHPAQLLYSSYFGGEGEDRVTALALDSAGKIVLTGYTSTGNLRVTSGALQSAYAGGGYDAFYARVDPAAPSVALLSYLGGGGTPSNEEALAVALDGQGNVYVTGRTYYSDLPVTSGAAQTVRGAGTYSDAYVLKLNPAGHLVFATYLGGNGEDRGSGIAVDATGGVYVAGDTSSTDFPTSKGAFQSAYAGNYDAFVARLSPDGGTLVYSTLLGGSGQEVCDGLAIDSGGDAYITGRTGTSSFPTTAGAVQRTFGGSSDAFVTRLNAQGTALVYSTFLGGSSTDEGYGIKVDSAGNAYIAGSTYSGNFPTTPGAFQTVFGGGERDAFVAKLNPAGSSLVYSTYLGGSGLDEAYAIAINAAGNAFVTGRAGSSNFPLTAGAYQPGYRGNYDVLVTRLNPAGSSLEFSTLLGGAGGDYGLGIALDASENVYVTGTTGSATSFPVTEDRLQRVNRGGTEAFLSKISSDGKSLLYSSFLGGLNNEKGSALVLDSAGNAYVAGQTLSINFPTTSNALLADSAGGAMGFLSKIDLTVPTDLTNVPVVRTLANPVSGRGRTEVTVGSIFAIVGEKLAKEDIVYAHAMDPLSGPLPYSLGGTSVMIAPSGPQVPLFQVHPTMIIGQFPYEAPLSGTLRVSTEGGDADLQYQIEVRAFTSLLSLRRTDGSEITATNPVDSPNHFYLYTTSFAYLKQPWPSGVPAPDSPRIEVFPDHQIKIGRVGAADASTPAIHSYELAPGLVGVARMELSTESAADADTPGQQWEIWAEGPGYVSNKLPIFLPVAAPKP